MTLELPISPSDFISKIAKPALELLPERMTSDRALVMLCSIALQESALKHRWQIIDVHRPNVMGPARGLLQFEQGTQASRGGVWGVYLHSASRNHLRSVCEARGVAFEPSSIYRAIVTDDILAACLGRLLLWTDPRALPAIENPDAAWDLYIRTWRPGKPHRHTWADNHRRAVSAV